MLTAIQFDVEKCFHAEEIKDVRAKLMLPPKFVSRKTAISQPRPKEFLSPRITLSQVARERRQLFGWCSHNYTFDATYFDAKTPAAAPVAKQQPITRALAIASISALMVLPAMKRFLT